jgi:hypothetical protein
MYMKEDMLCSGVKVFKMHLLGNSSMWELYVQTTQRAPFPWYEHQSIDFGTWLHWYAFDVITSITFSTRQGFMEREVDVDGIINAIEGRPVYNSIIGEALFLHKLLLGNNIIAACTSHIPPMARLGSVRSIVKFASSQLDRRTETRSAISDDQPCDSLARFKRIRDNEEVMTNDDLLNHATTDM